MSHELILVIDHQEYWREFSKKALESANFNVQTLDTSIYVKTHNEHSQIQERNLFSYETAVPHRERQGEEITLPLERRPDLIIVGCTQVGEEEQALIKHLLAAQYHLLVVSTFLPRQVMRSLFLQGVDDVADKPYTDTSLVTTVRDALQSILARSL